MAAVAIPPDDKDWTWVIETPCPACGFDPHAVTPPTTGSAVRASASTWARVLGRPDVRDRPAPTTWSPLEYGCHVGDVYRVFDERLALMLREERPVFENWDQDATALAGRYDRQEPGAVARACEAAAARLADRFDGVTGAAWAREGVRSNGSEFTVRTLAVYLLHDLRHHEWDVGA
jgi:hypothetical protein